MLHLPCNCIAHEYIREPKGSIIAADGINVQFLMTVIMNTPPRLKVACGHSDDYIMRRIRLSPQFTGIVKNNLLDCFLEHA